MLKLNNSQKPSDFENSPISPKEIEKLLGQSVEIKIQIAPNDTSKTLIQRGMVYSLIENRNILILINKENDGTISSNYFKIEKILEITHLNEKIDVKNLI